MVSLSSLIILSKLHTLLEGSLVFFAIPKFHLLATNLPHPTDSIIGPCGSWPPSSFWSLRNHCHCHCHCCCHLSYFYLSSFYSHAVSFHHISSSSFPHISFSFHHSSFFGGMDRISNDNSMRSNPFCSFHMQNILFGEDVNGVYFPVLIGFDWV